MSTSKDNVTRHSGFCTFKHSLREKLRRSSSVQSRLLSTNYCHFVCQHFPRQSTFDCEMLIGPQNKP